VPAKASGLINQATTGKDKYTEPSRHNVARSNEIPDKSPPKRPAGKSKKTALGDDKTNTYFPLRNFVISFFLGSSN